MITTCFFAFAKNDTFSCNIPEEREGVADLESPFQAPPRVGSKRSQTDSRAALTLSRA